MCAHTHSLSLPSQLLTQDLYLSPTVSERNKPSSFAAFSTGSLCKIISLMLVNSGLVVKTKYREVIGNTEVWNMINRVCAELN